VVRITVVTWSSTSDDITPGVELTVARAHAGVNANRLTDDLRMDPAPEADASPRTAIKKIGERHDASGSR
jgi:hypothetical protein